jgi:hypothetical protein
MKSFILKSAVVAFCAIAIQNAQALPNLQLDISNGVWDPVTETTVSTSGTFDVLALAGDPAGLTYYLSAAIAPNPAGGDFGSFSINGTVYNSANMTFGTPPIETVDGELASHGIFPTFFAEVQFNFNGASTIGAYNVQDGTAGPGNLFLKSFAVDMTGVAEGFNVHFDLYTYGAKGGGSRTAITDFAPFSHDAEGQNVPDGGATAALLGLGVLGLAAIRRKN